MLRNTSGLLAVVALLSLVPLAAFGQQTEDPALVPKPIPAKYKTMKNPVSGIESIRYGGMLFSSQCAMCHGKAGKGDGDLAQRFELKIPDFSDPAVQKQRTDGEYFYIIIEGHGRMRGQGERFKDHNWDLVNYIRSLAR